LNHEEHEGHEGEERQEEMPRKIKMRPVNELGREVSGPIVEAASTEAAPAGGISTEMSAATLSASVDSGTRGDAPPSPQPSPSEGEGALPQGASPLVSVIMPTTGRETMAQAARSVFEQTLPDWELVMAVNNAAMVPISDLSEIEPVQHGDRIVWLNLGQLPLDYTTHRVRALPTARGTYVATLDDDDWYEPAFMERMVATLEKTGADIAYCATRLIDKAARPATGDALGSYFHPFDGTLLPRCAYLLSNTMLMRRSVFDRVHWRPEYGYNSDWQLYVDAHQAGLRFVGVDEVLSNARVVNGVWANWAPGGYRRE
jgi:hypothetical protein